MENIADILKASRGKREEKRGQYISRQFLKLSFPEFCETVEEIGCRLTWKIDPNLPAYRVDATDDILKGWMVIYEWLVGKGNHNFNNGFLVIGEVGSGKTMMVDVLIAILRQRQGLTIAKCHILDVQQEYLNGASSEKLYQYNNWPYFFDDIGIESKEVMHFGNLTAVFPELINRRYSGNKMTFITSNMSIPMFEKRYDERTYDRLKQIFRGNVIVLRQRNENGNKKSLRNG